MRLLIRAIRIYTPFICALMALLNGVLFLRGVEATPLVYLIATFTGNSLLVDLFMLAASMRMCIWYKLNIFCLFMVQICGLLYNYMDIPTALYLWVTILFSIMGIISFLVFRIFYTVTHLFGCSRRR